MQCGCSVDSVWVRCGCSSILCILLHPHDQEASNVELTIKLGKGEGNRYSYLEERLRRLTCGKLKRSECSVIEEVNNIILG